MMYKQILDKGLIDYEINKFFNLEDIHKVNGIRRGGVYILFDKLFEEVVYVGVSYNLFNRLLDHKNSYTQSSSLANNLLIEHKNIITVKEIISDIQVQCVFEEDVFAQDFLEKYLIAYMKPKFNKKRSKNQKPSVKKMKETIDLLGR